jgi:hypothetical protein
VRKKIVPSDIAGVAMQTSPTRSIASTAKSTPGLTTNTAPCSPAVLLKGKIVDGEIGVITVILAAMNYLVLLGFWLTTCCDT